MYGHLYDHFGCVHGLMLLLLLPGWVFLLLFPSSCGHAELTEPLS